MLLLRPRDGTGYMVDLKSTGHSAMWVRIPPRSISFFIFDKEESITHRIVSSMQVKYKPVKVELGTAKLSTTQF